MVIVIETLVAASSTVDTPNWQLEICKRNQLMATATASVGHDTWPQQQNKNIVSTNQLSLLDNESQQAAPGLGYSKQTGYTKNTKTIINW